MHLKGSTEDLKGSTMDLKGSTEDLKGSTMDLKGSTLKSCDWLVTGLYENLERIHRECTEITSRNEREWKDTINISKDKK